MEISDAVRLEWPPPGLERIHGRLSAVSVRARTAAIAIAPAILWAFSPLISTQAFTGTIVGWLVVVGLVFYLRAILLAAGVLDQSRAARRLGYTRALLLEVVLDRARDTAALVNGYGMYDIVRDRTRRRVRVLRTLASAMRVLASVMLIPSICLALVLAMHGAADIIAFTLIPALPFLFLSVTAAVVNAYASVLIHWDRGSEVWDPAPQSAVERALEWQAAQRAESGNSLDPGTPAETSLQPRPALRSFLITALGSATGIAIFVTIAAVLAIVLGGAALVRYRQGSYVSSPGVGRAVEAEYMRPMRLSPDSSITARRAGEALHTLLYPTGLIVTGMRVPVARYDRDLWSPDIPAMSATYFWRMIVDHHDTGVLREPARAAFDTVLAHPFHPALTELSILARASDIDVTATRFTLPVDPALFAVNLPRNNDLPLAATIDAATRFSRGDAVGAELRLREMLSAGLLLIDRSPFRHDLNTGFDLVAAARQGLAFLYAKEGRQDRASGLAAIGNATGRVGWVLDDYGAWRLSSGSSELAAASYQPYPALRWTAFQAAMPAVRCGSLAALMFGPPADKWQRLERVGASLVRLPSDSLLLQAVLDGAPTAPPAPSSSRPGFRRLVRIATFIVGRRQAASPCLNAFTTRF